MDTCTVLSLASPLEYANALGYIAQQYCAPKLIVKGKKSTPLPAFTAEEAKCLLAFMNEWRKQSGRYPETERRQLGCDYVEMLLLTGIRHSAEAYYKKMVKLCVVMGQGR
jgi:hypothetical protein